MSNLTKKMLGFKEFLFLPYDAPVRFGEVFHVMHTRSLANCPFTCHVVLGESEYAQRNRRLGTSISILLTHFYFLNESWQDIYSISCY